MENNVRLNVNTIALKESSLLEEIIVDAILIPFIFGMIRYRRLDKDFRLFLFYLFIAIANTVFLSFRHAPVITNLARSLYGIIESAIFIYIFLSFSQSRSTKKYLPFFIVSFLALTIAEYFTQGVDSYRISSTSIVVHLFLILLGIYTATKILESTSGSAMKCARLLLVIPIVIIDAATTYLDILMFILYTPQNQPFFHYLFNHLNLLNLLVYIAFTISFLCLPRKKIFL